MQLKSRSRKACAAPTLLSKLMRRILRRSFITGPRFTPIVNGLPSIVPFVSPEEIERSRGRRFAVRLGANELTFGPSEKAVRAMAEASSSPWMYGDPKSYELRAALADQHGVDPLNIVGSLPAEDQFQFEEKELLNGRLAMIAVTCYVAEEFLFQTPVVRFTPDLFQPIIFESGFRSFLDQAFQAASMDGSIDGVAY